jgi:O-antigen ligase
MKIRDTVYQQKLFNIIEILLKYSTYMFVFYILTAIRKGGDLRQFVPYITFVFIALYLIIKKDFAVLKSHLFYALLGYMLVSYLLLPFSFDPSVSIKALNREILTGTFLFVAMHLQANSDRKIDSVTVVFIVILILIVSCGYFTFFHHYFKKGIWPHMFPEIDGLKFFLYHNRFAMTINLLLPFVISYMISHRGKKGRYFLGLMIVLSIFAVVLSLSRGGWASLAVTTVVWVFFSKKNLKKLLFPLAIGIIVLYSVLWFAAPSVQKRIDQSTTQIKTLNERTDIWLNALSAINHSPVVGWGYGDSIVWDSAPFLLNELNWKSTPKKVKIGSHNTLLHVLFHQGIIGFTVFIYFVTTGLVLILKEMKRSHNSSPMLYAIVCVFFSVVIVHSSVETVPFQFICMVLGFFSGLRETLKVEHS